jgi:hypothetical protein
VVGAVAPPLAVQARVARCVRCLCSRVFPGDQESEGVREDSPPEARLVREHHKGVACLISRSPTLNQKMPKTVDSNWCETCSCLIPVFQPGCLLLKKHTSLWLFISCVAAYKQITFHSTTMRIRVRFVELDAPTFLSAKQAHSSLLRRRGQVLDEVEEAKLLCALLQYQSPRSFPH